MQHAPTTETTDLDVTAVIVCRDDEEVIGHRIRRLSAHLQALGVRGEILAVDESSGDNTLPLLSLLRRELPALKVVCGVAPGRGFVRGAELARGRALVLLDARSEAPLSSLGFALARVSANGGHDAFAVHGRYLVLRRARALDAFDALSHRRDPRDLERRFLRRAKSLGLRVELAATRPEPATPWRKLRDAVLVPLASRAWW